MMMVRYYAAAFLCQTGRVQGIFATGLDRLFDHRKSGAFTGGHSTSVTSGLRLFIIYSRLPRTLSLEAKVRPVRFTPGRVLLLALVLSSEQQIIQKCIVKAAKNRQRNGDQNNDPYQADGLLVSVRQARISRVSASIRGVRHSEAPLKFH